MTDPAGRRIALTVEPADEGRRLDHVLSTRVPGLSRSQAHRLIKDGRVTLSHGRAKPALPVSAGLAVTVDVPAPESPIPEPEPLPLTIVHDAEAFAVIDKPAGIVVHPAAGHARGTLVSALLHHLRGLSGVGGRMRPGIVHRLDRGTSGLMVVAKTDRAHQALSRQFQERRVAKEYLALVWGAPAAGSSYTTPIGRDPRQRRKMSSRARRARPATTSLTSVEKLGGVSLVSATIATGRTHQIRVHLSEAGHPVVGDELYGGTRRSVPPRLAALRRLERPFLHAARLRFADPDSGAPLVFESALPADLAGVLAALRRASGRSTENLQP